jgi:acetaldehyde dehydrogenase/alcohol dehydrogenase
MWLLYEHPDTKFDGVAMRFMDIRKRVYELPTLGKKAEVRARGELWPARPAPRRLRR